MEFLNAGDLWLISAVYEDGTAAALEELIGSHGGVGGEQTDAFILHPADMDVPETRKQAMPGFSGTMKASRGRRTIIPKYRRNEGGTLNPARSTFCYPEFICGTVFLRKSK